jgi:hypothetical protein
MEMAFTVRGFRSTLEREAMEIIGKSPVAHEGCKRPRYSLTRVALPILGSLLAVVLAGCETSSSGTGNTVVGSLAGAPVQAQAKPVAFAPIIGAPAKVSSKMTESLTAAAKQKNLTVASTQDAEYTIRGYLVAAADAKGSKLSYIWDITDKSGKRAKRIQGDELIEGKKGGDPWALVDDAAIERIAAKTADEIVVWMPASAPSVPAVASTNAQQAAPASGAGSQANASSYDAAPAPQVVQTAAVTSAAAATAVPVVLVQPVTGAPGDGQSSLTEAMRRHLERAGVKLIESDDPNAYTVRGTVQLGSADGGQQPVTIRWLVIDPSGKTMEKAVVQRNKVPEGSLNGSWGQVADLAAGEAAKSVARLIKQSG